MELRLTPEAEAFVREWENSDTYITAHTSGTTGTPKEIHLAKSDMEISARATCSIFGIGPDSHLWLPLSPDYIAGKMQIVRALTAQCSLTVEPPTSAPMQSLSSDARCPDLIPVVPAQLPGLMGHQRYDKIGHIIVGGAPLPSSVEAAAARRMPPAYATYGMTETCSHVALRRLGCGYYDGVPGFTFGTDERGCLSITASPLSIGPIATNDVVELITPTRFRWLGRADNVINSGGVKIHPEEIEGVAGRWFPGGARFYVTSRVSDRWGEEAIIVTDSETDAEMILSRLRDALPPHKVPKAIVMDSDMKLTPTGKIIREKFPRSRHNS